MTVAVVRERVNEWDEGLVQMRGAKSRERAVAFIDSQRRKDLLPLPDDDLGAKILYSSETSTFADDLS